MRANVFLFFLLQEVFKQNNSPTCIIAYLKEATVSVVSPKVAKKNSQMTRFRSSRWKSVLSCAKYESYQL
jgi:hypothetical protein